MKRWKMARWSLLVGLMTSVAGQAVGEDPAQRLEESPRHHEWVTVEAEGDRQLRLFVAFPETDQPALAVVVLHENRGLDLWARSVADQLAEAGYVAVAPDFLSGTGPDGGATDSFASADDARSGIYELPADQVMTDLDAAVDYARRLDASSEKVAVAGFCWGGGQAFRYAAHSGDIAAAFVFYGPAPDRQQLERVQVPVYGFYGSRDFRITGQVPEVEAAMQELDKTFVPVVYEGAQHAFMRRGEGDDGDEADQQARDAAWKNWKTILQELSP